MERKFKLQKKVSLDALEQLVEKSSLITDGKIELNLKAVEWIDISAVLLMLLWVRDLATRKVRLTITPPESARPRDFFLAWGIGPALKEAWGGDYSEFLPEGNENYFNRRPLTYYTGKKLEEEYQTLSQLQEHGLLQVRSITNLAEGNYRISKELINEIADALALESVVPALMAAIPNCTREWAMQIGSVLVYQALLNSFEHPNANLGYFSLAKYPGPPGKPNGGRLVIAIADNGETIASTIDENFGRDQDKDSTFFDLPDATDYDKNRNRIVYATNQYTSRKIEMSKVRKLPEKDRPGTGLFYMKKLTRQFDGDIIIRCDNASVKFRPPGKDGKSPVDGREIVGLPRGNLVRVSIPVS